jgi:prolyl 4-hydroxylase
MVHELTTLGPDLFRVSNLLSRSLCDHLIEVAECCPFESAGILVGQVDSDVRSNDLLALDRAGALGESANEILLTQIGIIQKLLRQEYGAPFGYAEPCSILRYETGQFYRRHVDNFLLSSRVQELEQGIPTRDISIVGYLNDDFEGGETYFDRQNIKVRPEAGSAIVFPSHFTHPHQALPVSQGRKYAFTTWLYH